MKLKRGTLSDRPGPGKCRRKPGLRTVTTRPPDDLRPRRSRLPRSGARHRPAGSAAAGSRRRATGAPAPPARRGAGTPGRARARRSDRVGRRPRAGAARDARAEPAALVFTATSGRRLEREAAGLAGRRDVLVRAEQVVRVVAALDRAEPLPRRAGIRRADAFLALVGEEVDVRARVSLPQRVDRALDPGLVDVASSRARRRSRPRSRGSGSSGARTRWPRGARGRRRRRARAAAARPSERSTSAAARATSATDSSIVSRKSVRRSRRPEPGAPRPGTSRGTAAAARSPRAGARGRGTAPGRASAADSARRARASRGS